MFKKLFGKKEESPKTISVVAPLSGTIKSLEEVPDPVFSQKMMGDGIAILPDNGKVVSPVDGEIMQLFPTKHAVGIKASNGAELLIHIGLETVSMKGEGFEAHVSEGSKVQAGDPLITFDVSLVEEKAKSTITPIILTNGDDMGELVKKDGTKVEAGSGEILEISSK
ncbi:PTS glucose transporter subunit IIA [Rossellomorea marisflavi]|uniref:PTS glucose transporter subunit IIA n=1 Tax=Rossellomorea marisflavi TaxID=189381 RepID=A0A5D4RYN5_9BACI|nr:PTS glucose transporter subunit IIA [Rossellomorea marisflavi]MBV6683506.1 PTS glucose transporter subunit IIA [Bacillus sp. JRC01]TYS56503.1 PTS glucose transporter subunit IIA [Rossellomorea marisflavi]WJV20625.1 PTS glucose transporter subunit IIA [Rossellomorea marisflavi]